MCSLQVLPVGASYDFGKGDLGLKGKVDMGWNMLELIWVVAL